MDRKRLEQRLERLKSELDYVGHRAYSRDDLNSKPAIRDFARLDSLRLEIRVLTANLSETTKVL